MEWLGYYGKVQPVQPNQNLLKIQIQREIASKGIMLNNSVQTELDYYNISNEFIA